MLKTIIITGASSGIGYALADFLAENRHNLILVGRNENSLQQLHQLYARNTKVVVADITKEEDLFKIKNCLPASLDGIYLIHNAGIGIPGLLKNMSQQDWDMHYLTNTKAPVFLTKILLPNLKNGGRVLNISTGLAHNTLAGFSAYGISKTALYMWKEYCNAEFNQENILFGSAMPGIVDTPIQEKIRVHDSKDIPAITMFHGFKQRDELLSPVTAAKFIAWLLMETDDEKFIKGDWDIYDTSHHQYWANADEVKSRN